MVVATTASPAGTQRQPGRGDLTSPHWQGILSVLFHITLSDIGKVTQIQILLPKASARQRSRQYRPEELPAPCRTRYKVDSLGAGTARRAAVSAPQARC